MRGVLCIVVLLVLVQCSQPLPESETRATDESNQSIRISSGGVGYGGYVRISLWLLSNLKKQYPERDLWLDYHLTQRAFRDGLLLIGNRKAEISVVNTHSLAAMALRGRGLFNRPIPLRAIAALPSPDWCIFAVDAKLGVRSYAELKEKKVPLKIATGFMGGDSAVTFLLLELLKRHGIDPDEFQRWGGQFLEGTSTTTRERVRSGEADAVFHEAAYREEWQEITKKRPLAFLSVDPAVAQQMQEEFGWAFLTVPANHFPGQDQPFLTPDFSDWLITVREDVDEELAYRLAQIVIEKAQELDEVGAYGSITFSSLDPYSIDPVQAIRTSIPLHPGARRYYQEKGLLRD